MPDSPPPLDASQRIRVAAQLAHLRELFPGRYDAAQWEAIERQLAASARKAAALRSIPLANGDEPEIVFAPVRAAGRLP